MFQACHSQARLCYSFYLHGKHRYSCETTTNAQPTHCCIQSSVSCGHGRHWTHIIPTACELFRVTFPDSGIVAIFSCVETKCAYPSTFGIAPHLKSFVVRELSRQAGYVMMFKSLNKAL